MKTYKIIFIVSIVLLMSIQTIYAYEDVTVVENNGYYTTITLNDDDFNYYKISKYLGDINGDDKPDWEDFKNLTKLNIDNNQISIYESGLYRLKFYKYIFTIDKLSIWDQWVYVPYPEIEGAEELAKKYLPIISFHPDEEYYPKSLEEILYFKADDPSKKITIADVTGINPKLNMGDDLTGFMKTNGHSDYFFNFGFNETQCDSRLITCTPLFLRDNLGGKDNITVYYDVSKEAGGRVYLTYHFFYAFDPKKGTSINPYIAAHAFDRESFTITFNNENDLEPLHITFGAHLAGQTMQYYGCPDDLCDEIGDQALVFWDGGRVQVPWSAANKVYDHPIVYLAKGAHAIYPAYGWYKVLNLDTDKVAYLDEPAGAKGFESQNTTFPWELTQNLKKLDHTEHPYLAFSGYWVDVLVTKDAKFPFFTTRAPYHYWVGNAESAFTDENGNLRSEVEEYFNIDGQDYPDKDGDLVVDSSDQCLDTDRDELGIVNSDGCKISQLTPQLNDPVLVDQELQIYNFSADTLDHPTSDSFKYCIVINDETNSREEFNTCGSNNYEQLGDAYTPAWQYSGFIPETEYSWTVFAVNQYDVWSNTEWRSFEVEPITPIFADPNLQACIDATGLPYDQIADLSCIGHDISSIEGLQNLTSLQDLNLRSNQISDLAPLQNLTALQDLYLDGNQISDLTPLQNLTALQGLYLHINQISDLTPLQRLTALQDLDLSANQISDLIPLQNLTALRWLSPGNNQISDLTPLQNLTALRWLMLDFTPTIDLTTLPNLTSLSSLTLIGNQISDLTPLQNLTALVGLYLSRNQITDLTPLQNLTALRSLSLDYNQISDATPLQNLTALQSLYLGSNQISDLTPLQNLVNLSNLGIVYNCISDFSPLNDLPIFSTLHTEPQKTSCTIGTPTNLSAVYQSSDSWNYITWTPVDNAAEYRVYWGTETEVDKNSEMLTPTTTTDYGHTGVVEGNTYYYRVSAVNDLGYESGLSDETSVFVPVGTVGTVTSATGRVWMDRNLGASQVATAVNDAAAYGDLYQWGRGTDGHEKRTSPTTTTLSSSDTPGHGDFITTGSAPYDWRSPQKNYLWQGTSGANNPCPSGFRLPTTAEWEAERLTWSSNNSAGAFASPLKLVSAGYRYFDVGENYGAGYNGRYWSSSVDGSNAGGLLFFSTVAYTGYTYRATGFSVRCLED